MLFYVLSGHEPDLLGFCDWFGFVLVLCCWVVGVLVLLVPLLPLVRLISSHPSFEFITVTCASYPCEKRMGAANWGQGTWDRELGTGNWDRELELGTGNWALFCVVESVFCCWRRWNHGPEVAECWMKEWDSEMGVTTEDQFCSPRSVCKRFVFFHSMLAGVGSASIDGFWLQLSAIASKPQ